jgi:hypothetical protein
MSHPDSRSTLPQGACPRLRRALGRVARVVVPKTLYHIDDDFRVPRRTSRVNMAAVCVFLGFLIFPFLMEAFSLWAAQWFKVLDKPLFVQTPLLDFCASALSAARDELGGWAAYHFDAANLDPRTSLAIAALLLVIAARSLRTSH